MRQALPLLLALFTVLVGADPIARYTFTPEACAQGFFPNNNANNANDGLRVTKNNTIQCAPSLGVRGGGSSITSIFTLSHLFTNGSLLYILLFF